MKRRAPRLTARWLVVLLAATARPALAAEIQIVSCDEDFVPTVRNAVYNAQGLATIAKDYMDRQVDANPGPYEAYFGPRSDEGRRATVAANVEKIHTLLTNPANFVARCEDPFARCGAPDYASAYVDKKDVRHWIYVCPDNFKKHIALGGFNSQAGVFVHEASHFYDIAGTNDIARCNSNPECLYLGANHPEKAVANATSYQYLEEDLYAALGAGCGGGSGSNDGKGGCGVSGRPNTNMGTLLFVLGAVLLVRRRRREPTVTLLAVLPCLAVGCASTGRHLARPPDAREYRLTCSLSVPPVVACHAPVEVWFVLTNISDETLHILKWSTPFVPNDSDYMTVRRRDGSKVPSHGLMVDSWREPAPGEYLTIEPGRKVAGKVDLTRNFDLPSGEYEAEFQNTLQDAYADVRERWGLSRRWVILDCNRVRFRVE